MAKPLPKQRRLATELLDPRVLHGVRADFLTEWRDGREGTDPLRLHLEKASEFRFTDTLLQQLQRQLLIEGLNDEIAEELLAGTLAMPSVAFFARDGDEVHVRHAVVFSRTADGGLPFEALVTIDARIRSAHHPGGKGSRTPAAVTCSRASITLLDLEDDADIGDVLLTLAEWHREFPLPNGDRELSRSVIFLGDPMGLGAKDTPREWRRDIEALARVLGFRPIIESGVAFTGKVPEDLDSVFRFDPYHGKAPDLEKHRGVPSVELDARARGFHDIYREIAICLRERAFPDDDVLPRSRALQPGERVYHRKVGSSQRYDHFGEPCKPCNHGSFRRFHGPKALKGFARIYSNFKDEWMHHCDRYPTCGVYAVFAD